MNTQRYGLRSLRSTRWWLVLALCFLFIIYLLRKILIPFFLAAAFAYILSPFIGWLQRRTRLSRLSVVLIFYVVLLGSFAGLAYFFGPGLAAQLGAFFGKLPDMLTRLIQRLFGGDEIQVLGKTLTAQAVAQHLLIKLQDVVGTPTGLFPPEPD